MPGRQAHGRPLLGGSKPASKPNKKSKSKTRSRALDAFSIAQERYPTKEKRTPRFRELDAEVGQKHRRAAGGDEDEGDDDDAEEDADEQPRRKRVKPSAPPAGGEEGDEDEYGSDSEGNEWRYGAGEDDSDLDSDEAFGDSDEEAFADYTFRGSSKKGKKPKRRGSDDEELEDSDDFDPGADGEDLGDEAIDLAQALDQASDESDEEEDVEGDDGDSGSDESDEASSPPSSDDEDAEEEDADPNKLAQLQSFIKDYGGEDDKDGREGSKAKAKISFKDLGLSGVKDPQMKKSMKLMSKEEKETRPGAAKKLGVPLSKRQQDKLLRDAAYNKTNETLDRWNETVKANRRAEHLVFPLPENAQDSGLNYDELQPITAKNSGNELEQTIMSIMQSSGLSTTKEEEDKKKRQAEQGGDGDGNGEGLSKEALKELVNQKRRERELNSREAKRQARIKKIKSKAYHRVHRKQRERDELNLQEAMAENGEVDSEEERERQDRARALERVGGRHRDSRWAKAGSANKRAVWDDDYRAGLHDMARKEEELRKRKEGRPAGAASDDEDEDDESDDTSDEEGGNRGLRARLDRAEQYGDDDDEPQSKLMKMKFMQRAEAAQKQANDEMIAQIRKDLDSDAEAGQSDDEVAEVGRKSYGGAKSAMTTQPALFEGQEKREAARRAIGRDTVDADVPLSASAAAWSGPDGAAALNIGSSITAGSSAPSGNAWSSGEPRRKGKKRNVPVVDTINTADTISAASSGKPSKAKAKSESKSGSTSAAADADTDADSDDADIHLPLAVRDVEQLDRAFAGDNVMVDFDREKADMAEEQDDQVVDETLPGWGSWVGDGVSAKERGRHKGRFLRKVEGTKQKDRKDAKLDKVIINEKRVKNNDKYLASQLPHPFESRAQYERSLRLPMGPEWMTKESFQEAVKPRVMMKQGIIAPMSRPSR